MSGEAEETWAEARLAYLEGIVDGLGAVVWEWDDQRRIYTYVSDGAERLLGFSCDEWLKPGFWESHLHPDEVERIVARSLESCVAGCPDSDEYRMLHRDGRTIWVRDILSEPGEPGVSDNVSGLLVDITDAKLTQERLAMQAREFDEVFRATGDLYFLVGADGVVLDYKAPSGLLYAAPNEFLGRRMTDAVPWELHHMLDSNLKLARETQTMVVTEYELPVRGRNYFWEARFLPVGGDNVAVVSRDVSERHAAARLLAESQASYRALVEVSPYAICVVSLSDEIVFANAAMAALIGARYSRDVEGLSLTDLVPSDGDAGAAFGVVRRLAEDIGRMRPGDPLPKAPPTRVRLRALAGDAIEIEWTCAGIIFRGEPNIFAAARDVTDEAPA